MRTAAAPAIALLVAAAALWAASACGSFSASDTPVDMAEGGGEGAADGPGGEGSTSADGTAPSGPRRIYVIGGEIPSVAVDGGAELTNSVLYATQQDDGGLGAWAETTPVISFVHGNAAVASDGAIVTLAGEVQTPAGPSAIGVPSRARILSDGRLDNWADTQVLTDRLYFHAAVTVNGRVYVMGGNALGKGPTAGVRFATVAAEGTIGTWTDTTPLPAAARTRLAAATDGVHIFVVGGESAPGQCETNMLVGTIASSGEVESWAATGEPYGGQSPGVAVFAHKLYVVGGFGCGGGASPVVHIADIHPDGTLGTFTTGAPLPSGRSGLGAVVLGQYLYVVGGNDGSGPVADVSVANLDGAGAYDTWHPGPPLLAGRSLFGFAAR